MKHSFFLLYTSLIGCHVMFLGGTMLLVSSCKSATITSRILPKSKPDLKRDSLLYYDVLSDLESVFRRFPLPARLSSSVHSKNDRKSWSSTSSPDTFLVTVIRTVSQRESHSGFSISRYPDFSVGPPSTVYTLSLQTSAYRL